MQPLVIKIIAIILTVLIIAALTLFILGKISTSLFWLTLIITAFLAFYGIPYLKKNE